jgi:hypothetical protein
MKTSYFALLAILAAPLLVTNVEAANPKCPDNGIYEAKTNSCLYEPFSSCDTKKHVAITISIMGGPEKLDKKIEKCKSCVPGKKWNMADFKCE